MPFLPHHRLTLQKRFRKALWKVTRSQKFWLGIQTSHACDRTIDGTEPPSPGSCISILVPVPSEVPCPFLDRSELFLAAWEVLTQLYNFNVAADGSIVVYMSSCYGQTTAQLPPHVKESVWLRHQIARRGQHFSWSIIWASAHGRLLEHQILVVAQQSWQPKMISTLDD